jgi:hypothetical protein
MVEDMNAMVVQGLQQHLRKFFAEVIYQLEFQQDSSITACGASVLWQPCICLEQFLKLGFHLNNHHIFPPTLPFMQICILPKQCL